MEKAGLILEQIKKRSKMKPLKVMLKIAKHVYGTAVSHFRKLTGKQQKLLLAIAALAVATVFLFCLSDKIVDRLGTLASIVIAGLVCSIQYDTYRKNLADERKREGGETCTFVIDKILKYAKTEPSGDIILEYMGNDQRIAPTPDGKYHIIEWQFRGIKQSGEVDFRLIVGHFTDSQKTELTGNFESIEMSVKSGVPYSGLFRYRAQSEEELMESKTSVRWNDLSKYEWEVLMLCVYDILKAPDWKQDPSIINFDNQQ